MNGIDVSAQQGQVDFKAVKKSGVDFVLIQAGADLKKDPFFEQNYKRAKEARLHVGAYWSSNAADPEAARAEAAACIEVLKNKKFDFPIFYSLDNNPKKQFFPFSKGKEYCSQLITAFCTELEKAGYFIGFNIPSSYYKTHVEKELGEHYKAWITGPKTNIKFDILQHSSSGRVVGVIGDANLNITKTDFSLMIVTRGLNGYEPEFIEYEMKKGDTLTAIAKEYKTTIQTLKKINNIEKVNLISVGDVLKIPRKDG